MSQTRDDVRRFALSLAHAVERAHRGAPAFRVGARIFCRLPADMAAILVKLDGETQSSLTASHPGVVAPARLYARHGWTQVRLDLADEALLHAVLRLAWSHAAPKRMVKAAHQAM